MDHQSIGRFGAVLYFVAAAAAFISFAVGYSPDRPLNWSTAAAGVFCVGMGLVGWWRGGSSKP